MEVIEKQNIKYTFSGHETFQCRQLWLKKGYDYIKSGKSFTDEAAVVYLGVGKNMVTAINFWMKAFNLIDKDGVLTDFAIYLLDSETGKDPYLEDEASLWLLHYHLIKKDFASTYKLIFNKLRREKIEFTKDNFVSFVKRELETNGISTINEKTVSTDFDIFVKMYKLTESQGKDLEDTFSGLLTELNLLKFENRKIYEKSETFYFIENVDRPEIPDEIILYAIVSTNDFDKSINIAAFEFEDNSISSIFALNRSGLVSKLENLASSKKLKSFGITYSDHAGVKELQFKNKPQPIEILNRYYGA